ncbi:hypothetical protein BLS_004325 [Venturia inaequalis]|uniref:C2H2-type domain-containing protein n=1 Tax=Venturia inaequalis TaxID=5025 RepID=A0A8H3UJ73_VENIN|nr:hypothetical protein BLS_004325 [Venturia inaequalis]
MAPTARISGGESLSSPMRITYDSGSSDEETAGKASKFMSSLKGPKKFLNDRKTARKASSTTNLARDANAANSRTSSFANRSRIFVESISNASQTSNVETRHSNTRDLQTLTRSLPERGQFLKRSNNPKESHPHPVQDSSDVRTLTLRIRSESQEEIQTKPMIPRSEPLGNCESIKIPKRKRSLYHGSEVSDSSEILNRGSSQQARRHQSESGLKRAARASPAAEAAVMEWIESVDPDVERRKSEAGRAEVADQPSPAKRWSQADVVMDLLEENQGSILRAAAAFSSPQPTESGSSRKRDSAMTNTTSAPSIFSRLSTWTDGTSLTAPSEMLAGDGTPAKKSWRDSRESYRFSRNLASARSSMISGQSMPFRSRPFGAGDFASNGDPPCSFNQELEPTSEEKVDEPRNPRFSDASSRISGADHDFSSVYSKQEGVSTLAREATLSPVKEMPNEHAGPAKPTDASRFTTSELPPGHFPKGARVITSLFTIPDAETQGSYRGSPNSVSEPLKAEVAPANSRASIVSVNKPSLQDNRRSILSDGFSYDGSRRHDALHDIDSADESTDFPTRKGSYASPKTFDRSSLDHVTMKSSPKWHSSHLTESETSTSVDGSDFDDISSGITDYSSAEMRAVAELGTMGPVFQTVLANVRRDVLSRVLSELNATMAAPQDADGAGTQSGYQRRTGAATPSNHTNRGASNKRPSRDREPGSPDDREDGDNDKRRKTTHVPPHPSMLRLRFACPFFKHNADNHQRWRSCRGPGWEEVRRVKEHVYRRHTLFTCPRCQLSFEDSETLNEHAQAAESCTIANHPPEQPIEGCNKEQERKLRCRKRQPGETDEDRWAEMYRILFGDDVEVPGPYYDFDLPTSSPSPTDLPLIEEMLRALPQRLAEDINRHFRRPLNEELRAALPGIIQNSLQDYMQPFWRMFTPNTTETRSGGPPPSDPGDSAYGSLTNDGREGSAGPPRSTSRGQPSRTSHHQAPVNPINPRNDLKPSEVHVETSADLLIPTAPTWQSSTSNFVPLTHVPEHVSPEAYENYPPTHEPQRSRGPTIDSRMAFAGRATAPEPPATNDLFDFLVPQPTYTIADAPLHQRPTSASMLRWANPVMPADSISYTTNEVSPNFPSFSYPLPIQPTMPHIDQQQQHLQQMPVSQGPTYATTMAPQATMAASGMTMAPHTTASSYTNVAPYTTMPPNMSMAPNTSISSHAVNPAIQEALATHNDVHQYHESLDNTPAWMWNWTNGDMVQPPHSQLQQQQQQQSQMMHHLPAHIRQSQQNHASPHQQQHQHVQPLQQVGRGVNSVPPQVHQFGGGAASTTSTTRNRPKSKPLLRDMGTEDTDPFYDGRVGRFM